MADINDVYAWMVTGNKLNLAMTLSPGDPGTRHFDATVQYVFHLTSKAAVANVADTTGTDVNVVCTFASDTDMQCWVVSSAHTVLDYVKGDPSNAAAGVTSADGKIKVFAGRRSDPFFFNLGGFKNAVHAVQTMAAGITFDAAHCPNNLTNPQAAGIRGILVAPPTAASPEPPCPNNVLDCFATFNVMSIVVQVDASLVNTGANTILAVWGSTNTGS